MFCQGGSVTNPVAAAARPNPQRSAGCTRPRPGRTELRGGSPATASLGTTTPDLPLVFPRGRGSRSLSRRPALAATARARG